MHTNACGFSNSWSSLLYLAPSDFLGLEHLTSSCRSVFAHSCSLSRRFIHGSGWWNGSGIRRRAVEASRTHLKSSIPLLRLPLCEALATVCGHPCTALREDSGVLSTGANQWDAIGVHPTPPHQSCCRNSRICSVQSNLCQCAFARCESALWWREWCAAKSQHEIHRELASCSRRCKEIREFLITE